MRQRPIEFALVRRERPDFPVFFTRAAPGRSNAAAK
jgi:hypothetical protein